MLRKTKEDLRGCRAAVQKYDGIFTAMAQVAKMDREILFRQVEILRVRICVGLLSGDDRYVLQPHVEQ